MTKKTTGAKIGRPKGSGDGLGIAFSTRVTDDVAVRIGRVMEIEGVGRAEAIRMVIEIGLSAWEGRKKKGTK